MTRHAGCLTGSSVVSFKERRMTFDELLEQVIDLLQRQGRVSYGALKRRFALDDNYLQDLKDELIDAQRLAVDEDGKVLVWTGGTASSSTSITSDSGLR